MSFYFFFCRIDKAGVAENERWERESAERQGKRGGEKDLDNPSSSSDEEEALAPTAVVSSAADSRPGSSSIDTARLGSDEEVVVVETRKRVSAYPYGKRKRKNKQGALLAERA